MAAKPPMKWEGFYSVSQTSRLAKIPRGTLYIWGKRVIITPPIQPVDSEDLVADEGYTYADLTNIKIMRALRDDKLDLNSVGIALKHLFERLGATSKGWSDAHVLG